MFHESKEYLKECLTKIKEFLKKEKLELNIKTRIFNSRGNIIYLGRNKKGKYSKYRSVKRKIKKSMYLYNSKKIKLSGLMSTIKNYEHLLNRAINIRNEGKK